MGQNLVFMPFRTMRRSVADGKLRLGGNVFSSLVHRLENPVRHIVIARAVRTCLVVAVVMGGLSSASAANYTWKTLSGTGNWTASANWSGTSATNLYPGSVGSGPADGAVLQAM